MKTVSTIVDMHGMIGMKGMKQMKHMKQHMKNGIIWGVRSEMRRGVAGFRGVAGIQTPQPQFFINGCEYNRTVVGRYFSSDGSSSSSGSSGSSSSSSGSEEKRVGGPLVTFEDISRAHYRILSGIKRTVSTSNRKWFHV
jgi:uncharacterized membrane protein YgcG